MEQIAIVVGGSSGIGLKVCEKLLQEGYTVYNLSRRECPLKDAISKKVDVSDTELFEKTLKDICQENKTIHVLVYCSGFSMAAEIENVEEADYRYLFEVNYFGVLSAIKTVTPFMTKNKGRIVTISSVGAMAPIPYDPYYCSSKAALDMLIFTLRSELDKKGIYVTTVLPGGTKTQFTYKRKIYDSNDKYLPRAVDNLYKIEQKGILPERVAKTVINVIKRKNPPIKTGGGLLDKLLIFALRLLPQKLVLFIIKTIFYRKS